MSTGRKQALYSVISNGAMASNITGIPFQTLGMDNLAVQFVIESGSPTGSYQVQVSNSLNPVSPASNEWVALPLPSSATSVTSGSPSSTYLDLNQLGAVWVQCNWIAGSGSGVLNALFSGKQL